MWYRAKASGGSLLTFIWLFMVSTSSFSTLRDPFMPFTPLRCQDTAYDTAWRLRGVVGHQQQWMGWLSTPEHPWLAIQVGDVVASSAWRVSYLDQHQVRLVNEVNDQQDTLCPVTALERVLLAPLSSHDNTNAP